MEEDRMNFRKNWYRCWTELRKEIQQLNSLKRKSDWGKSKELECFWEGSGSKMGYVKVMIVTRLPGKRS